MAQSNTFEDDVMDFKNAKSMRQVLQKGGKEQFKAQVDDIDNLFDNENDSEQMDMIKQYNIIKKDRKNVENNQKLLENRINLLKQEEIRTLKKIEETRKKSLEIYYLKQKNEEKQRKKDQEREQARVKNQGVEEQRKQIQQEHKILIDRKKVVKKIEADKIKRISEAYQVKLEKNKQTTSKKFISNRMEIQKGKEDAKKKIEQRMQQKKQLITDEIKNKIEYEQKIKQWKEREIESLENFEMDLIQRLQNTQQMQKTAFDELESALTMPAKEFAEKFLKPKTTQTAPQQLSELNKHNEQLTDKNLNQSDDETSRIVESNKGLNHNHSQPEFRTMNNQDNQEQQQEQIQEKDQQQLLQQEQSKESQSQQEENPENKQQQTPTEQGKQI